MVDVSGKKLVRSKKAKWDRAGWAWHGLWTDAVERWTWRGSSRQNAHLFSTRSRNKCTHSKYLSCFACLHDDANANSYICLQMDKMSLEVRKWCHHDPRKSAPSQAGHFDLLFDIMESTEYGVILGTDMSLWMPKHLLRSDVYFHVTSEWKYIKVFPPG